MEDETFSNESLSLLSKHSIQNIDIQPVYFKNELKEGTSGILASIMNLTLGCIGAGETKINSQ
jgi:hypothetical protein